MVRQDWIAKLASLWMKKKPLNSCGGMEPLLADFSRGELSPEIASLVDAHVKNCVHCQSILQWREITASAFARRITLDPPADMHARVLQAISKRGVLASTPPMPSPQLSWRTAARPAFAMACTLVIVAAAGVYLHNTGTGTKTMVSKGLPSEPSLPPAGSLPPAHSLQPAGSLPPAQSPLLPAPPAPREISPIHKLAGALGLGPNKPVAATPAPPRVETPVAPHSVPPAVNKMPRAETILAANTVPLASPHAPAQPAPSGKMPVVATAHNTIVIAPKPVTIAKAPETIETPPSVPSVEHEPVAPSPQTIPVDSAPSPATVHTAEYDPMSEVRAKVKSKFQLASDSSHSQIVSHGHYYISNDPDVPTVSMVNQELDPDQANRGRGTSFK